MHPLPALKALLQCLGGHGDDEQVALNLIQQNATRLNTLVEDLLVRARIGQQTWDMQSVEVQEMTQDILRERAGDIERCGAEMG